MAIIENKTDKYIYRYSDLDLYIIQDQTGAKYISACDSLKSKYTYTESDEEIPDYILHPEELKDEETEEVSEEVTEE